MVDQNHLFELGSFFLFFGTRFKQFWTSLQDFNSHKSQVSKSFFPLHFLQSNTLQDKKELLKFQEFDHKSLLIIEFLLEMGKELNDKYSIFLLDFDTNSRRALF